MAFKQPVPASDVLSAFETATSYKVKTPANTKVGDLILAGVIVFGTGRTFTATGWTQQGTTGSVTGGQVGYFTRIATETGEHEYPIGISGAASGGNWGTARISSVNGTTPVVGAATAAANASTTIKWPTGTPTEAPCMDYVFDVQAEASTITTPTGFTRYAGGEAANLVHGFGREYTSKTATGETTATQGKSLAYGSLRLFILGEPEGEGATAQGKAAGTAAGSGTAKGQVVHEGKAAGTATVSGTAKGTAIAPAVAQGKAAGTAAASGTAKGVVVHEGKAAGSATGSGTAAGKAISSSTAQGRAAGTAAASGTAAAHVIHRGVAAATANVSGTARAVGPEHVAVLRVSYPAYFPTGTTVELYVDPHIGDLFDLGYESVPVTRFLGDVVATQVMPSSEEIEFSGTGVEEEEDYLAYANVGGDQRLVRLRLSPQR